MRKIAWGLVAGLLLAVTAQAAVPESMAVSGSLQTSSGGPVADGVYVLTFSLFKDELGGAAVWSEAPLVVPVKNGGFATVLGAKSPLSPAILAQLPSAWLEVTVAPEPALARRPLHAVAYALRAEVAENVGCSGCIGAQQLDPALLKPYAKQTSLADVASSGAYADLQGLPKLVKTGQSCGTGLVVQGVAADGTLQCIAALDKGNLPPDGLAAVSNGLLTDQFTDVIASAAMPLDIPDNNPAGVSDTITVPDLGVAQKLSVSIDLTNSDLSKVKVVLQDPSNKSYLLFDGGQPGTELKATYPAPQTAVSGDLALWVGQNPKGAWKLEVTDAGFLNNTKDGKLNAWSVTVQTLSNQKVAATGLFIAGGGFQFQIAQAHPVACTADKFGYTYANSKDKSLYVCNGQDFYPISLVPLGTAGNPAASCKDLLKKAPNSKDGVYWLTSGSATFQTYCDMTNNDGGWTLAARMVPGSWCQIGANASGALTSPGQAACAKLSDTAVKSLYSDQFWLSCGSATPSRWGKIDDIVKWNTTSSTGDKKMTWSASYGGATYGGTDDPCCNFGDHNYHTPSIIYSISVGYNGGNYKAGWDGCYNSLEGWSRPGYLYVR